MSNTPFRLPDSAIAKNIRPAASGRDYAQSRQAKPKMPQRQNPLLNLENAIFSGAIKVFKRFYDINEKAKLNTEQMARLEYMILTGKIVVEEKRLAFLK